MLPRTLIGCAAALMLAWAGQVASAAPQATPIRVAQAPAVPSPGQPAANPSLELARATARARQRVATASSRRDAARSDKAKLAAEYENQLAAIDQLKRRRASWRRDRLIRNRLRESQATAKKLASLDQRSRALEREARVARAALAAAIDRELAAGPVPARRTALLSWRKAVEHSLRRKAKPIVLPDDAIDPLADPEELDYQASLILQSERQLARELAKLEQQSDRYSHMATLRKNRRRAVELGGFDDDRPRRGSGRLGARGDLGSGGQNDETVADPAGPSPSPPGDGPIDEPNPVDPQTDAITTDDPMFHVILAEVVDSTTIDALRAAEVSSDPAVKARAAERARQQVKARLERLKKRRSLIQNRARTLRR